MSIYSNKKKTVISWFIIPWIIAIILLLSAVNLYMVTGEKLKPFVPLSDVDSEELYQLDLKRSISEGVSVKENKPLYLKGDKTAGILLIHGFTGTPYEMLDLSKYLNNLGYNTYSVRIPGSGTSIENMNSFTYKDWYYSLKYGYYALKNKCDNIYVIGQSLGGLLAAAISRYNETSGTVFLNPALKIKDWKFNMVPIMQLFINKYKKSDFDENNAGYYYREWPAKGMYQLYLLQKYIKNYVHEYKSPLFLIQSKDDDVVDYKGVLSYFESIDTVLKERVLIEDEQSHVLTLETVTNQDYVFQKIKNWIGELEDVQ